MAVQQPRVVPPQRAPAQATASGDILGFPKQVFVELLKWGAIAGVVAGVINFIGGLLTSAVSWFGVGAAGFAGSFFSTVLFAPLALFSDLFWGALWGIVTVIIVVKFHDKFPMSMFKSLFMKFFGLMLIIDIVVSLLFGLLALIFAGPLSFVVMVATLIVADLVFAKIAAAKAGPVTGLQ